MKGPGSHFEQLQSEQNSQSLAAGNIRPAEQSEGRFNVKSEPKVGGSAEEGPHAGDFGGAGGGVTNSSGIDSLGSTFTSAAGGPGTGSLGRIDGSIMGNNNGLTAAAAFSEHAMLALSGSQQPKNSLLESLLLAANSRLRSYPEEDCSSTTSSCSTGGGGGGAASLGGVTTSGDFMASRRLVGAPLPSGMPSAPSPFAPHHGQPSAGVPPPPPPPPPPSGLVPSYPTRPSLSSLIDVARQKRTYDTAIGGDTSLGPSPSAGWAELSPLSGAGAPPAIMGGGGGYNSMMGLPSPGSLAGVPRGPDSRVGLLSAVRTEDQGVRAPPKVDGQSRRSQREALSSLTAEEKLERRKERARMYSHIARKRQETNMRELKAEVESLTVYRLMIEEAPDMIAVLSPDIESRFLFANGAFARILHVMPSSLLGSSIWTIIHEQDKSEVMKVLGSIIMATHVPGHVRCKVKCSYPETYISVDISMRYGRQGGQQASTPIMEPAESTALRIDVQAKDARANGPEAEEEASVLSPHSLPYSPQKKKKTKEERACPRRRRRRPKRPQQQQEGEEEEGEEEEEADASAGSSCTASPVPTCEASRGGAAIKAGHGRSWDMSLSPRRGATPPRALVSTMGRGTPATVAYPMASMMVARPSSAMQVPRTSPPVSMHRPRPQVSSPSPPQSLPPQPPPKHHRAGKRSQRDPPPWSVGPGGGGAGRGDGPCQGVPQQRGVHSSKKQSHAFLRSVFPAVSYEVDSLPLPITDEEWNALEQAERQRWQEWANFAAEQERERRMMELRMIEEEEARERRERRAWAKRAIEEEQRKRIQDDFMTFMTNTQWFNDTISSFCEKYEIVCPYARLGCRHICLRNELEEHLKLCKFGNEKQQPRVEDTTKYEVICPNSILGCQHSCPREDVAEHLQRCQYRGPTRGEEQEERNHWKKVVIEETEEERARRVASDGDRGEFTMSEKRGFLQRLLQGQIHGAVSVLHRELVEFSAICSRMEAHHRPTREAVVSRLGVLVAELWPRATAVPYGSYATGLMLAGSDLDVVVCGYPAAAAGAGDPLTKLAAHLRAVDWVEITQVLPITRVPIIKLVAKLDGYSEVRVDLSMDTSLHTGIATASLVSTLASRLPPLVPLTLLLKHLLKTRGLADPYTGGVPSYGIILMVTFLLLRSRHACHSSSSSPVKAPPSTTTSSTESVTTPTTTTTPSMATPGSPPTDLAPTTTTTTTTITSSASSSPSGVPQQQPPLSSSSPVVISTPLSSSSTCSLPVATPTTTTTTGGTGPTGGGDSTTSSDRQQHQQPAVTAINGTVSPPRRGSATAPQGGSSMRTTTTTSGHVVSSTPLRGGATSSSSPSSLPGDSSHPSLPPHTPTTTSPALPDRRAFFPPQEVVDDDDVSSSMPPSSLSPPQQQRLSGAQAAEEQRRRGVCVAESVLGQVTWPESDDDDDDGGGGGGGGVSSPVLGQLLMDFFHLFGEDFEHGQEGISVRAGGFRFPCKANPPHPQASDPFVVEDPINTLNNVTRSTYRIQAVQRAFGEALSNLRALIVRYNETSAGGGGGGRGGLLMSPRSAAAAATSTTATGASAPSSSSSTTTNENGTTTSATSGSTASAAARESILFYICQIDLTALETQGGEEGHHHHQHHPHQHRHHHGDDEACCQHQQVMEGGGGGGGPRQHVVIQEQGSPPKVVIADKTTTTTMTTT